MKADIQDRHPGKCCHYLMERAPVSLVKDANCPLSCEGMGLDFSGGGQSSLAFSNSYENHHIH